MAPEPSNGVFISYRREVSQYMAMALWQNLTAQGIDVFYDIESLRAGYFDEIIRTQIAARPYMVPILAPGALNRCVDEDDWLRRELEAAIATGSYERTAIKYTRCTYSCRDQKPNQHGYDHK